MFQNITIPTKYLSLYFNSVNKSIVTCNKGYNYILILIFFQKNICLLTHPVSFFIPFGVHGTSLLNYTNSFAIF